MHYTKTISLRLYECKIQIIICSNIEKVTKGIYAAHQEPFPEGINDDDGYVVRFGSIGKYYLVFSTPISVNLVFHEHSHLVDYIAEDREIKDAEAKAWLAGHLGEEIFNFLKSKKISL